MTVTEHVLIHGCPRRHLLVTYLRPHWVHALWLALTLLATIVLQLLNPQIIRAYIDTARSGGPGRALTVAALLYIAVAVAIQAIAVIETYVAENLAWVATNRLRADLALHCLRLDMSFHTTHTPGEMIERIDGDVTQLANYFSRFVVHVLGNLILLLGVLILLFRIDWRVGLTFTGFTILAMLTMRRVQRVSVPHVRSWREASAGLYGFLEERLSGTEDLRANGAVPYTIHRLIESLRRHLQAHRAATVTSTFAGALFFAYWGLVNALTFGLGAYVLTAGAMTIGTIYLIYAYSQILLQPVQLINEHLQDFQTATASMARIAELLSVKSLLGGEGAIALSRGPLSVVLQDVSFRYDGGLPILHDISFSLAPGKSLGLLGRTGSGKTTVARLLVRLYDPTHGRVLLDGSDLRDLDLSDLRRRVGMVTQDVQLFQGTIRNNLTFFDRSIPDQRLLQTLDDLGLRAWYQALPYGLDTELAASGSGLSAGEAQLVALARVFLKDPGLVILDEASSRLDPATEQLTRTAINRLLVKRTGIIIAHRLETVQQVDEIMILEGGHIVEYGLRATLAADQRSRFAHLLRQGLSGALA